MVECGGWQCSQYPFCRLQTITRIQYEFSQKKPLSSPDAQCKVEFELVRTLVRRSHPSPNHVVTMDLSDKMARILDAYPRPPVYAQATAQEICKVDRKRVRFVECNVHEAEDPDYQGCNHPEDADEFHPDGGPAVGRVDHTKGKKPKVELADITLGDLFASVCYPTYNTYFPGIHTKETLPDRLRVCLTKADERVTNTQLPLDFQHRIMLRVRALNQTLFMNLNDVAKSIVYVHVTFFT